jgi:4'-phosphopantetheinyl transferase
MPISSADEIRLWHTDVSQWTGGDPVVTPDELTQSARFLRQVDQLRFVRRRSMLRSILSMETGIAPLKIELARGPNGKPFVAGHAIQFSLAKSGDHVLIGVSSGDNRTPIGVDIECHKPDWDCLSVARRMFAPELVRELECIGEPEARLPRFYEIWTSVEAYVKATGSGLAGLSSAVHLTPVAQDLWRKIGPQIQTGVIEAESWVVRSIHISCGTSAAVATQRPLAVSLLSWP